MGFFDRKWVVEFEYSRGILSSIKKATIVVEASNETSAKSVAKATLKPQYSYVKVLSARVDDGRKTSTYKPTITETKEVKKETNNSTSDYLRIKFSPETKKILRELQEREQLKQTRLKEIFEKQRELKQASRYHIGVLIRFSFLFVVVFLLSWIPNIIFTANKRLNESMLESWIEFGHSQTDKTGQKYASEIEKFDSLARNTFWIPFVVLGLCVVAGIFIFIKSKKKTPAIIEGAKRELDKCLISFKEEFGDIDNSKL